MAVVYCCALCHLHEAAWQVFAQIGVYSVSDWLLSVGVYCVIYMRQVGGCPDGAGVYSIIYIRPDGGCLLGVYSVSYTRRVGGRLQMAGVYTVSYMSVGCV
jgi:hypothetical protein